MINFLKLVIKVISILVSTFVDFKLYYWIIVPLLYSTMGYELPIFTYWHIMIFTFFFSIIFPATLYTIPFHEKEDLLKNVVKYFLILITSNSLIILIGFGVNSLFF
jgi:hypothetical protein